MLLCICFMVTKTTEKLGIECFIKWVESQGGKLENCSRKGVGYDFEVIRPNSIKGSYEVKGTKKELNIPDMSVNEFDKKVLKADWLFVVGNVHKNGEEKCYKIPREALKKENLKLKQTYHIRLFQNRSKMGKYQIKDPLGKITGIK